tara:strand:+ start:829 stop:1311 length:483 start_codon:yes stop_codon:yes gene_type:complete
MEENKEIMMSDDPKMEMILQNEKMLRDNFDLEDFLDYDPTNHILELNRMNHFEDVLSKKVEDFYENERIFHQNNLSNIFYYEQDGSKLSTLKDILWNNLEARYDLEEIYEAPHVAISIMEHYDEIVQKRKKRKEEKRLEKIRKNRDLSKIFDWKNKEFKK